MKLVYKLLLLCIGMLFIAGCGSPNATFLTNNIFTGNITNTTNVYNNYTNISFINSTGGWADYVDTQYNSSSTFTATGGNTVHFPNNAGTIRDSQIPQYILDSGGFYNGTHFIGRNGDAYGFAIRGQATPSSVNTYCQFNINISGSVGNLPLRLLTFPKGAGVSVEFEFATLQYTLDTWESNGGNITVNCNNNVQFWDISYKFAAMHKANSTMPVAIGADNQTLSFNTTTNILSIVRGNNVNLSSLASTSGGSSNFTCPQGFSCPTTYAELRAMSINDSIKFIWGIPNTTYTEDGNDWFITNDKVINMNGATIDYDTTGCSGGNIHPYTNKNIEISNVWLKGDGCSTAMFYNVTSGGGHFKSHNVKITDVPQKTTTLYFKSADIYNWNLSYVQAGMTFDNTVYDGLYYIDKVFGVWDNTTSATESELIDINHLGGYARITNIVSGTDGGYDSFAEQVIDCNINNCDVENVLIYNTPTLSSGQSLVYLDTTNAGDKVFHASNIRIFDLCNNMIGVRLGGSTTTGYDTGSVTDSNIKGCNTNSSTNNAGIRVAGNMVDVNLINNNVNGTYYGVLSSVGNLALIGNTLRGTTKDWHDSAAAATRQTNIRMDRQTMQQGSSGYLCIDNPVREWIVTYGATC